MSEIKSIESETPAAVAGAARACYASFWGKLRRKWDWWIYCRAVHSLRRMTLDNPGMAYLMELQMREWNEKLDISPELRRATECFHESLRNHGHNDNIQPETVASAEAKPDSPATHGSVFEVVDSSNEETYWTLGIWPTLQEALTALAVENPEDVGCNEADEYDEHRTIEVRERKIGWGGSGKRVAKVEWKATWDESADKYEWARVQTLNDSKQKHELRSK